MTQSIPACLFCGQTHQEIPLINMLYRDQQTWICPQHLPMLIHKPQLLAGKLPGAEGMAPAEHHD